MYSNPMLQNPQNLSSILSHNPIVQQMGKVNNALNTINNPMLALQNMITSNPKYQEAMNFINSVGGDPKQAYYSLAKQKGVDPDNFLQELSNSLKTPQK